MEMIFKKLKDTLNPGASIIIEISNVRTKDGIRPLAWQLGELLSKIYSFEGDIIRCNTSNVEAGPGFDHSYLLAYKNVI
jgi:hypothetical protein